MEVNNISLENYIESHTTPEPPLLEELRRKTHIKVLQPRMLSGPVQGQFLKMMCQMIQPQRVLEIGTFTGYSAICMAQGMPEGSRLITIEKEDEREPFINDFIHKAGFEDRITLLTGNALDHLAKMEEPFDLVFVDADKREYPEYYRAVMPLLNPGGYLLADNILWNGKVIEPLQHDDHYTKGILEFNKIAQEDPNTEQVILPLRDGLMLIRKRENLT